MKVVKGNFPLYLCVYHETWPLEKLIKYKIYQPMNTINIAPQAPTFVNSIRNLVEAASVIHANAVSSEWEVKIDRDLKMNDLTLEIKVVSGNQSWLTLRDKEGHILLSDQIRSLELFDNESFIPNKVLAEVRLMSLILLSMASCRACASP